MPFSMIARKYPQQREKGTTSMNVIALNFSQGTPHIAAPLNAIVVIPRDQLLRRCDRHTEGNGVSV